MRFAIFAVLLVAIIGGLVFMLGKTGRTTNEVSEVRRSIPPEEIISGGPPQDGIPSIDNPKFISIEEANAWLKDNEPGIAFSRGNTHRFYPYQIIVWHEIVNDTVEGERILVTYCPLCLTGFIFDPLVKGERVEFGTSGKLWKSNLVMYDRKTDSLWAQILGEAIAGEVTGTKLKALSSDQMLFGNWKKAFPAGEVLSRDTGAVRFYGSNPYGDYFSTTNLALSLAKPTDTRLPNDAFVLGIVRGDKAKAYSIETVKSKGEVQDVFEGITVILRYDKGLEVVRMFEKVADGTEQRINPFSAFWFSWAAAHPDTELYTPANQEKALLLSFADYDGRQIALSGFVGKPLVINSWAAWCPFCKEELKDFAVAQEEFGTRVVIVAIDRAESLELAKKYSDELGVTDDLIFLLDPSDSFYQSIGGFSMPETIFVDRTGKIVDQKRGPMKLQEIRERIQKIL